jgi:hypothetical protein
LSSSREHDGIFSFGGASCTYQLISNNVRNYYAFQNILSSNVRNYYAISERSLQAMNYFPHPSSPALGPPAGPAQSTHQIVVLSESRTHKCLSRIEVKSLNVDKMFSRVTAEDTASYVNASAVRRRISLL